MKSSYKKTKWVDDKTLVSAQNMNKIENALSVLYQEAIENDELIEGEGISIDTDEEGCKTISVDKKVVQTSLTCTGLEVVSQEPVNPTRNKLYFILDSDRNLSKIMMNGITIFNP